MRTHPSLALKPVAALLATLLFYPFSTYADGSTSLGTVSAEANGGSSSNLPNLSDSVPLSPQQVLNSTQPVQVVTSKDISLYGPNAGGRQALSILPKVAVTG